MNIMLTQRAVKQLLKLKKKNCNIFVSIGGVRDCFEDSFNCYQESFKFEFTPKPEHPRIFDEILKLDDDTNLVVEEEALLNLVGTEIDYSNKFLFKNNSITTCNCKKNLRLN